MKGVVFTEFLEMVEQGFGEEIADRIIEESDLPSGGAYTAVGTYDHAEILQLVTRLSAATQTPVAQLVEAFGRYLFGRFAKGYPQFFEGQISAFDFLSRVENYIHVEVRKLYPDAQLPTFECRRSGPNSMELTYRSSRPFADLAQGLIAGCADHFGEPIRMKRQNLSEGADVAVLFNLQRVPLAAPCKT